MNLWSCESCGVVLDHDHMEWPDEDKIWNPEDGYNEKLCAWDGDKWVRKTSCPVCKADVMEKE